MKYKYIIISLLIANITETKADNFTYPRFDMEGKPINAHAGGIIYNGKNYYWYGEYRNKKPSEKRHWDSNQKVTMYESKDLKNWKYLGIILDLSKDSNNWDMERPKIIYNKKNKNYVMWFHLEPHRHYIGGYAGVAISSKINGPYKLLSYTRLNKGFKACCQSYTIDNTKNQKDLSNYKNNVWAANNIFRKQITEGQQVRDLTLFQDTDGVAYIIYETEDDLSLQVAELDENYIKTTGKFSRILVGQKNEAPSVIKKDNKYFLLTSGLSGYNPNPARSYVSEKIFGPWKSLGNPARSNKEDEINTTFHSQPSYIFKTSNSDYYLLGDLWDTSNGGYKNLWKSGYIILNVKFGKEDIKISP